MSASRSSFPASTCCMTAVQVKSLETEPGRNRVRSGSTGRRLFMSEKPNPLSVRTSAVLDDDDDRAGDVAAGKGIGHQAVEPAVHVGLGQQGRAFPSGRSLYGHPARGDGGRFFLLDLSLLGEGRRRPEQGQGGQDDECCAPRSHGYLLFIVHFFLRRERPVGLMEDDFGDRARGVLLEFDAVARRRL